MKNIIVTTTIHEPTEALLKFAKMKDWHLIVVGDQKTPHDSYKDFHYLSPSYQEQKYGRLSDAIGWNCIQRRNIGLIEAYRMGAEVIATVDDDNIPYESWGENLSIGRSVLASYYTTKNEVFDPLSATNYNYLWHRGFPIELIPHKNKIEYRGEEYIKPLIQADLWNGDPDIDAICRIAYHPEVEFTVSNYFFSNQIAPFNSQNTFLHRSIIPDYFLYPKIGRMDDIFASYHVQKIHPRSLVFGPASVYQKRNIHNLSQDLEDEMIGYRHGLEYVRGKFTLDYLGRIRKLFQDAL